jgi:hypothetical protein
MRSTGRTRVYAAIGVAILTMELGMFVRARFVNSRYFCWAPFHSEARYRIDATVRGGTLSDRDIATRYGIAPLYWDERSRENWELNSIEHVLDAIAATEATYPESERASVDVVYRVNGRAPARWHYP